MNKIKVGDIVMITDKAYGSYFVGKIGKIIRKELNTFLINYLDNSANHYWRESSFIKISCKK